MDTGTNMIQVQGSGYGYDDFKKYRFSNNRGTSTRRIYQAAEITTQKILRFGMLASIHQGRGENQINAAFFSVHSRVYQGGDTSHINRKPMLQARYWKHPKDIARQLSGA